MASLGAKLVLGARHEEALIQIAEEVRAVGAEAAYCVTDVSRRKDLLNLVHVAVETFGQLDVLFSNAGAMPIGTFDELAVDDWEAMVDVNIKGVLFGIAAALPVFRKQRPGTSSILHRRLLARQYQIRGCSRLQRRRFWLFRWPAPRTRRPDPRQHYPAGIH